MVGMVKFNIERCDGARVEGGGGVGVDPVSLSQPNPNPMRDGKPQALWWCCKLYLVRLSIIYISYQTVLYFNMCVGNSDHGTQCFVHSFFVSTLSLLYCYIVQNRCKVKEEEGEIGKPQKFIDLVPKQEWRVLQTSKQLTWQNK